MELSAARALEIRNKQYNEVFPLFLPQTNPEKNVQSNSKKVPASKLTSSEKNIPLKSSSVNSPNAKRKATTTPPKEIVPEVITIPESPPCSPILTSIPESPEKSDPICSEAKRPKLSSAEKENKSGSIF
jgi:hypothetical protein